MPAHRSEPLDVEKLGTVAYCKMLSIFLRWQYDLLRTTSCYALAMSGLWMNCSLSRIWLN